MLILFFFSVWPQLTEEMEKAHSLIDDMSSQLNEVKSRLVSDIIAFLISLEIIVYWGGSVAEWSARRTRNPAVPGSSPAMATCWICSRSSRVQILGHACK